MIVDLSSYQRGFDFRAFKAGGGLASILKATEGETWRDPAYHSFTLGATQAGLPWAAYHFIRTGDGIRQAEFFLNYAALVSGKRAVVDWEDRAVDLGTVIAFLRRVQEAAPGVQLTVYGSPYFLREKIAGMRPDYLEWLRDNTSLWLAQYTHASSPVFVPPPWPLWTLWQYSQSGKVPGFAGNVDLSRFNGPADRALAWIGS